MPEDDATPVYLVGLPSADARDLELVRDALKDALAEIDTAADDIVLVSGAAEPVGFEDLQTAVDVDEALPQRVDRLEDDVGDLTDRVERLLAIVEQLADGEPIPEHTRRGFE